MAEVVTVEVELVAEVAVEIAVAEVAAVLLLEAEEEVVVVVVAPVLVPIMERGRVVEDEGDGVVRTAGIVMAERKCTAEDTVRDDEKDKVARRRHAIYLKYHHVMEQYLMLLRRLRVQVQFVCDFCFGLVADYPCDRLDRLYNEWQRFSTDFDRFYRSIYTYRNLILSKAQTFGLYYYT